MWIVKFIAIGAGCGVTVGFMLMVSAILLNKRRTGEYYVDLFSNKVRSVFYMDGFYTLTV